MSIKQQMIHALTDIQAVNNAGEDRLRQAAGFPPDLIQIIDGTGHIRQANDALATLFGCHAHDLVGRAADELVAENTATDYIAKLQQVFQTGENVVMDNLLRVPNREVWVETRLAALPDQSGQIREVLSVSRDITQRRIAEDTLDYQNRLLNTLLETLPIGVFMVEAPTGKPLVANRAAQVLLGRGVLADTSRKNLAEVYEAYRCFTDQRYPTDEMPIMRGMFGEKSYIDDMLVVRPDGTRVLLEIFGCPVFDKNGTVKASLVNFADITERKNAEQQLREREAAYRALFEYAYDAIFISTPHHTHQCNRRALEIFGASAEDFAHQSPHHFSPPFQPDGSHSQKKADFLIQEALAGRPQMFEWQHCRKDGTLFDAEVVLNRVEQAGQAYVQAVVRDITERKRSQQALVQSREQLRALSARLVQLREHERTRMSREIHDELGQLLTGLKMDLFWIERHLEPAGKPDLNAILDKVVTAGDLADQTIKTVQRLAAELRPGILDRLGLMVALRSEANRFGERFGIACNFEGPEQDPAMSPDVATTFFRIFQETLTNVARHAGATEVQARFLRAKGWHILEVSDNGAGITETALSNPKSLGLLGMRERAAAWGGDVHVNRGVPGGTSVTVRIPENASAPP